MTSDSDDNANKSREAGLWPFIFAAGYSALVVSIILFNRYGGSEYGIGSFAAAVAFVIAFLCAAALSPFFATFRTRLSDPSYFLLHLGTGMVIGAALALGNRFATEWHHFVLVPIALTVQGASLAAWLVVFMATTPGDPTELRSKRWFTNAIWILPLACIALPLPAIFAEVAEDPSCHNALRGQRFSVSPSLSASIQLQDHEAGRIGSLYDDFAESNGLSVRRRENLPDSQGHSICNSNLVVESGTNFDTGRHVLTIYLHEGAKNWEPLAASLICSLESNLESEVRITGGARQIIERPSFLGDSCRAGAHL